MSKEQIISEIFKPARKNFKRRSVILKGKDDLWQADLIDYSKFKKSNNNYSFILVVIDCFSKFAFAKALKTKTGIEVSKCMNEILKEGRRVPKNLQVDLGKEFYNKEFKKLMQQYDINLYSTYSTVKASIVERLIRTLKAKIYKEFYLRANYKWIDFLQEKIKEYNNTVHRTIKLKPKDVDGKK